MKRRSLFALAVAAVSIVAARARADAIPFFAAKRPRSLELEDLLQKQAQQWSSGDIAAFCSHYDDDALFVAPSGMTRGRQAVLDRYTKKYGAAKETMGTLTLEVLHIAAEDSVASIAMKWKLVWEQKKPPAEGFSVIGLQKKRDRWLIVHDASM